jgi:hypothetical protein
VLRTKFLKSFEEKIREIEAARNRELDELRRKHEESLKALKDGFELRISEKTMKIMESCSKAKSIISKAGMRPVDDFLAKKIVQCEDDT